MTRVQVCDECGLSFTVVWISLLAMLLVWGYALGSVYIGLAVHCVLIPVGCVFSYSSFSCQIDPICPLYYA